MELLSFTFLIIDAGIIAMLVAGIVYSWKLIAIAIPLFFLYPFIYEPVLKLLYYLLDKMVKDKKNFNEGYKELESKNFMVYHPIYNIKVCGIEKQHPFDTNKYERVLKFLDQYAPDIDWNNYHQTRDPRYSFLYPRIGLLHLILLNYSLYLSKIAELPVLFVPNVILRLLALRRFYYATQGSLDAADIAMKRGLAVNLGGGYHHAHADGGSGFCFVNDIGLVIQHLRVKFTQKINKILIIDLDAHQGNGHERDKLKMPNEDIYIFDAYNDGIFPQDHFAKTAINKSILLNSSYDDLKYLTELETALNEIEKEFPADFIIYNAGTDILIGDPLGGLSITEDGIIKRDELVFHYAHRHKVPILMLLSGGYQKSNAPIIAKSLININRKFNLA